MRTKSQAKKKCQRRPPARRIEAGFSRNRAIAQTPIEPRSAARLLVDLGVADLHRQPAFGAMQHGLAVKADDVDVFAGDAVLRGKGRDGLGVREDVVGRTLETLAAAGALRRAPAEVSAVASSVPDQP